MSTRLNIKKIIALNVLLYIATAIIAAIVLAFLGRPLAFDSPPMGNQIFVAMVTGIILTTFGAWWYFRTEPATAIKGLYFGIIAILVGFAMDAVISIGIWISGKNPLDFLQTSYSYFFFGIMLLGALILPGVVGWGVGKGQRAKGTST